MPNSYPPERVRRIVKMRNTMTPGEIAKIEGVRVADIHHVLHTAKIKHGIFYPKIKRPSNYGKNLVDEWRELKRQGKTAPEISALYNNISVDTIYRKLQDDLYGEVR